MTQPTLSPDHCIDMVHLLYPEDVHVSPDTVLGWAHDARPEQPRPTDLEEAKAILSDLGTHTFARC